MLTRILGVCSKPCLHLWMSPTAAGQEIPWAPHTSPCLSHREARPIPCPDRKDHNPTACGHCEPINISLFTKQGGLRVSHPIALHTHSRTKALHSSAATGIQPPNIFIQSKKSCPISYSHLWHFHQYHIHCEKSLSLLILILELVENTGRFSPVRYNSSVLI